MKSSFQSLGEEKTSQYFYDMNAPMEDNKQKRKGNNDRQSGGEGGQQGQEKRPRQTGPCWFCEYTRTIRLSKKK